jgi:hypothetical protein
VVIDGVLRTGAESLAGEIGHIVIAIDGPVCGCGNRGCFEALASRTAIERDIREAIEGGRESQITELMRGDRITAGALARALAAGDELVTEVMTRVGHVLGQGAISLRHVVDPDVMVFGGGVMEACGGLLLPIIEAEVRGDKLRGSRDTMQVVLSELGDDAVALGAAALAGAMASEAGPTAPIRLGRRMRKTHKPTRIPDVADVVFGSAVIDGKEVTGDVYVRADGKVRKRDKKPARERYGTSHVVDAREIRKLCKGGPATVVIGQGFQSMLRLTDDAQDALETLGVNWALLPTPDAVVAFSQAGGSKALLLHLTC